MDKTKEFLEAVLREVCAVPSDVEVLADPASMTLVIGCHDADCGRVVGKGGKFLAALSELAALEGITVKTAGFPERKTAPREYRGIGTLPQVREVLRLVARQAFGDPAVIAVEQEGKHRTVAVIIDSDSVDASSMNVCAAFTLIARTILTRHGQTPIIRLNLKEVGEAGEQPKSARGRFVDEVERH